MQEIISSKDTWRMIKRTLDRVDPRLVEHGEHVAFIVCRMLSLLDGRRLGSKEMAHAAVLALLHDIGAYKTEELDRMVDFETGNIWEHSIYGYLFLKQLSPLRDCAEVILYHHLNVEEMNALPISNAMKQMAALIKFADRIDILMKSLDRDAIYSLIIRGRGIQYEANWVDLFCWADRGGALIDAIRSGYYHTDIDSFVDHIEFSNEDRLQFLRLVAYSIDFRSEYMVQHTVTTVAISTSISSMLSLPPEEAARVYYGALLHDVGKIAIPIQILEKPGRLTDEEMAVMKQHVVISGEILKDYLDPRIYQIAVRHHEKIDGSGYPLGLKGESLQLGERIVAVADIISALIRKRSYKEAFDRKKTAEILLDMVRHQKICPNVSGLVLKNFDCILDEAEEQGGKVLDLYFKIKKDYDDTLLRVTELERHVCR